MIKLRHSIIFEVNFVKGGDNMVDVYGILDSLSELVYISDIETHKVLYMNRAAKKVLDDCSGNIFDVLHGEEEMRCDSADDGDDQYSVYKRINHVIGKIYMVRDKVIMWNERKALLKIAFDVTEEEKRKRDFEKRLIEMSYIDTLTDLYNRNKFIEDTEAMKRLEKSDFGVLYMDLNGLKAINDKKGHNAGDKALKELANVIVEIFGREHAYRVGGDEFVVLCPGVREKDFLKDIEKINERISQMELTSAIGYQYAENSNDIDEIVRMADEKMYIDKKYFYRNQKETSRYRFRNDTFSAISTPDLLKKLISEERFVIWFQPRFSVHTGKFSGSEALIRFFDDDDVLVSPMDFIPQMEDNETIHLIDFYVFRHVCEYISGWLKSGKTVKPVSVNISHKTMMKPNFIENIMNIWYDYNIPKELVIIEVSDEKEKGGVGEVVDILMSLKKCGFRIAIDNFGSKYADLYLFSDLKFDILKLDGDMVYKIETDKKAHILSTSIAQICHNENIKIVAEGVENKKALEIMRDMGCDEVQGYFFDKPMSWNKFEEKYL